jgi:uncharacterized protein involved in response to NO
MIQIQEKRSPHAFSLFNLGFRPFFLGGAISAVILILFWLHLLKTGNPINYYQSSSLWHSHEMIFGFTIAIIAGFLLTAVRNWTNVQTPFGWNLALLFSLWLIGRLVMFLPGVPDWLIATIDLSFIPALAICLAIPIIQSRNFRNLIFIPILMAFFVANLMVHAELNQMTENTQAKGINLSLFLVILLITVIGGRVIPFFTERGVEGAQCTKFSWIEKLIIPATVAWLFLNLTDEKQFIAFSSLALALMHLCRSYGWFSRPVVSVPLVWILQFSYLFIPLGFTLYGLAGFGYVSQSVAFHAFTVGAIGGMTLGMMARVSLGHTGRTLVINKIVFSAFCLILSAAVIRSGVNLLPLEYLATIYLSGGLWVLAWLLFLSRYTSILIKPRKDGLFG